MSSFAGLSLAGRVVTPGEEDWDQVRQAWNLAADQLPAAVALVQDAQDVARTVAFAAAHQLKVAAQGTGHGAVALGSLEETILIKTERMRGIEIDASAGTARVEAGVLAAELGAAAQGAGMCSLPGSAPDVGVVGYTLGGGMSWLGRRHGFACNRVQAIELVTADGEPRRVDAEQGPDLFWALRGGGGGYAIVTALHMALLPIGELYAGALILPAELGAEAVRAYRDWAATVPEEVTSIVRFLRLPPLPDVPEPLRDRPLLTLGAACIGSQAEGERMVAPLREIGEPVMDTFAQVPAQALSKIHMDPEHPVPGLGHHALIHELPDEAVEAFVSVAGPDAGSPLLVAELRHTGGAFARPSETAGALASLPGEFAMLGVGLPMSPEIAQAIDRHLDLLEETMAPWASSGGYVNFAERACPLESLLPAHTCERLAEVKRRFDPEGMIVANHPLAAASA
ncbi:MAG TPA: FAD-binding oxidoreductase [Solirubrobacteraceae bacterium]|nr:FAD-binding oxidoreductase [Solirubrobacteraceae bacterium]